jgi:hypothetical protein
MVELARKEAAERASFKRQWSVEQVRIVARHGEDVGWLQNRALHRRDLSRTALCRYAVPTARDRRLPVAHADR